MVALQPSLHTYHQGNKTYVGELTEANGRTASSRHVKGIPGFPIKVGELKLKGHIDGGMQPVVTCENAKSGNVHTHPSSLTELLGTDNLANLFALAKIVNFLFFKLEFHVVEDVEKYKEKYWERVKKDENSFDLSPDSLLAYGAIYDVKEVTTPHIEKKEDTETDLLVFYVFQRNLFPYRISCDYPHAGKTSCELLSDFV